MFSLTKVNPCLILLQVGAYSLVPRLSPLRRGEPGTFYHMDDIKDRHGVDMTKLHVGMHRSLPTYLGACCTSVTTWHKNQLLQ